MANVTCAFCKGTGKDQFDLLSELATCQVCNGEGKVFVQDPITKCPDCSGTGIYQGTRNTCTTCNGRGSIHKK